MTSPTYCNIAREVEDREQVYRLRYSGYLRKMSIDPLSGSQTASTTCRTTSVSWLRTRPENPRRP